MFSRNPTQTFIYLQGTPAATHVRTRRSDEGASSGWSTTTNGARGAAAVATDVRAGKHMLGLMHAHALSTI